MSLPARLLWGLACLAFTWAACHLRAPAPWYLGYALLLLGALSFAHAAGPR